MRSWRLKILEAICAAHGWDYRAPVRDLPPEAVEYVLRATKDEKVVVRYRHERGENTYKATFEGVVTNLERRYRETDSDYIKTELEKYMVTRPCPTCGGKRLRPEILGGHHRRAEHLGRLDDVDHGRPCAGRRGLAGDPQRARADDRPPAAQGDRGAARLPRRRRAGLPDPRPDERDAVRRRGPADPPGDPDRHDADGRPVHPRRAVDRAAPARQREAHRDADAAARPRQHGPRRRARRGDDPDGRLGRRHRARGRGARRRDHRQRAARGGPRRAALDHRRVPARRAGRADPGEAADGQRQAPARPRRPRAQPARRRPRRPARHVRRRDRRVGQRQEHARHGGALPGAGPRAERVARAGRGARLARGRRARRQDHRDRPEPDRADAAVQPGDLRRAVHADPGAVRRRPGVARPRLHAGALQLQRQGRPLRALQGRRHPQDRDAVPAGRLRRRARSARASATTARRSRSTTRASRSPTCSR